MTERERRQRRLLHVRALQADLAAARLQSLRSEEAADRQELTALAPLLHIQVDGYRDDWMLRCAERELHGLRAQQLLASIAQRLPRLEAEAEQEQQRRLEREQIQRLCDRTAAFCREERQRVEQASLDDLFSSAGVRARSKNYNES